MPPPGAFPGPPELFPGWITPKGWMPAIYAWRAYTSPTQSITSTVANPTPLSSIPAGVVAMVYYHSAPGVEPIRKTFDYGDIRPYSFTLPDGSTRTNATSMSAQAYTNLVDNLWASDAYPT